MHYIIDEEKRRIDLYFDKFPTDEIRNRLKSDSWKWNKSKRCWFTYLSTQHIETANALGATLLKENTPPLLNSETVSYSPALLNTLYSAVDSPLNIRLHPVSIDEFKSHKVPVPIIFQYTMLMSVLCMSILQKSSQTVIATAWSELFNFCKAQKLVYSFYTDRIDISYLEDCDTTSFDNFRLQIERFLTETDPAVQFLECVYGIDVIGYEWWEKNWVPTMCGLGHFFPDNDTEFVPLTYTELITLRNRIQHDRNRKYYPYIFNGNFDIEYWEQIILWNMEDAEKPVSYEDNTLYVHKGKIICQTRHHHIIQATAILLSKSFASVILNVNYCTQCKKFFIHYSTYQHYREQYGVILGDIKMLKREDFHGCEYNLALESPLHLCGYTVSEKAGLSSVERQSIITYVIENGIMEKGQVISHLNWLIDTNSPRDRMTSAIKKWNEDLDFTLKYNLDNQSKYVITTLAKYPPNQFIIDASVY